MMKRHILAALFVLAGSLVAVAQESTGGGMTPTAQYLLGKRVVVGITWIDADEKVVEQTQLHGTVSRIDAAGIELLLEGKRAGETFMLPPDPSNFKEAADGGIYNLANGETVVDPDFTSTWEVHMPRNGN